MAGDKPQVKTQDTAGRRTGVSRSGSAAAARPKLKKASSKKPKRSQRPPRAVRLSQAERRYNPTPARRPGVSVTVHIGTPKLHPRLASKVRRLRLPAPVASRLAAVWTTLTSRVPIRYRHYVPAFAVATVVVATSLGIYGLSVARHRPAAPTGGAAVPVRTTPDYRPLIPSATDASATSYDGKRDLYAYSSTFSGARLTVSQQALPARFAADPGALQAAADSLSAKQRIDTSDGPVYIATNETNDQLAIYAGKHVLLFIHTDRKLDDASWKSFIELLKEK